MNYNFTLQEQEELFASECKLINLKYEYNGYKGNEKFAIVTELTEEELKEKYTDIICRYVPFVLLSMEHGEVIAESHRIDDKHEKRAKRYGTMFSTSDDDFDEHHPEFATDIDPVEIIAKQEEIDKLHQLINKLSPEQKRRIIKYFFEEKSYTEIAEEEGASRQAVTRSIKAALENLKKFYN